MRTSAIDFFLTLVILLGLFLPLFGWLWIAYCKYIRHFHKDCNNCGCWYRCKKCPPLRSEQLEMRIALLEQNYPQEHDYIRLLREQLQMYLDNPVLDRETESEMIHRLVKEAKD